MTDTHVRPARPDAGLARFVPDPALFRVNASRVGVALAGDWLMIAAA
ncbi:fatty acid desaturase, partial [Escherichia coli]|nr:fatty acid desaturase [Escherichia coli]